MGMLCHIDSRQVEALCRFNQPSHMKIPTASVVAQPAVVIRSGPLLNYDDVPEAGLGPKCSKKRQILKRHQPRRFPVVFEEVSDEECWPDLHQEPNQLDADEDQWSCASCTFLNAVALPACEMCGQSRHASVVHTPVQDTHIQGHRETANFHRTRGGGWPSVLQSVESSWDLCDQSSMASMVDVAKLSDLECANKGDIEVVTPANVLEAEFFEIFSETASHLADGHRHGDCASVASSWHHVQEGCQDDASVASSWLDVGDLADIEPPSQHPHALSCSGISGEVLTLNCKHSGRAIVQHTNSDTLDAAEKLQEDLQPPSNTSSAGTTWSSIVSTTGSAGIFEPKNRRVSMPPLARRSAPKQKTWDTELDGDCFGDDQDVRGCARSNRSYRSRR